jgi:hypothetical protein
MSYNPRFLYVLPHGYAWDIGTCFLFGGGDHGSLSLFIMFLFTIIKISFACEGVCILEDFGILFFVF